jgi:hypothetical protein
MQPRGGADNLKTNRAHHLAGALNDLEFGEAWFQRVGIESHGKPDGFQRGEVFHRGAADAECVWIHSGSLREKLCGAKKKLLFAAAV